MPAMVMEMIALYGYLNGWARINILCVRNSRLASTHVTRVTFFLQHKKNERFTSFLEQNTRTEHDYLNTIGQLNMHEGMVLCVRSAKQSLRVH